MTNYDETDILKELLLEQIELNESNARTIEQLREEAEKMRTQIQALSKLADDLKKPLIPLLGQLLSSMTQQNNLDARQDMKAQKLQEMIEKHKASKSTD